MTDHAGQVCFPGGSVDPGESIECAALRELREEIGVHEKQVDVLGELSSIYLYNSNFIVTPCLGVTTAEPTFTINAAEVAELTCLPAEVLLDTKCRQMTTIERGTLQIPAPYWCWQHYCIWGATAMMLAELAEMMRQLDGVPSTAVLPPTQT
jgi:8-oxo-dGTP pyrophosphatase MutT (NUDIX family)